VEFAGGTTLAIRVTDTPSAIGDEGVAFRFTSGTWSANVNVSVCVVVTDFLYLNVTPTPYGFASSSRAPSFVKPYLVILTWLLAA
jgi:hypothetical protein